MDSGMISKIEKAKNYAEQRDRFHLETLTVTFVGDNNPHVITLKDNTWHCDCDFFASRNRCSHTIALERILEGMGGITEPVS